jgi:hypothetical protein
MRINGFTDYDIHAVVKLGGSLLQDLERCRLLLHTLARLCSDGHRLLIVPGGGPTDNTIEALNRKQPLTLETCHRACALAQDQTGMILCDPSLASGLIACESLEAMMAVLRQRKLPVLLPSRILFDLDPIEKTWDVTSDAVGAWFAWLVGAERFAIVTDVDGVYAPGKVGLASALISKISSDELTRMGPTSVDACCPSFLAAKRLDCMVLNGHHPERLERWLLGEPVTGTWIRSGQ